MCLGRRPIPFGVEKEGVPPQEAGKVAIGPSAAASRRHTFASLRSCSLAAFIHAFAELPLLTWPHLAQPLLRTADPAGDSLFSSPLGSTVAASRRRLKAGAAKAPHGRRGQDFTVWSKSAPLFMGNPLVSTDVTCCEYQPTSRTL